MVCLNALTRHLQPQVIQVRERAQVGAIKGSIGHVEVFQMDGVGTPIIGRPRPIPGHDTPNPANNTYTLNYEEPLSSGWTFLTPEEYTQLGPLADDPSVRLVAVTETKDEGNVPTFVVTGGALSTDASDDDVYADTIRQVEEALPGFHLIDDFAWPVLPEGARWRTGVYILDDVSLTLSQLTWMTRIAPATLQPPQRFLWTATCTCPSILFPTIIDDFITMAQTLEVTP